MRTWNVVALALVTLCGCSSQRHQVMQLGGSKDAKLERGAGVVIATPEDGRHDARVYAGSGLQTGIALQAAFGQFTNSTRLVKDCAAVDCLRGQAEGGRYLVVPQIVNWEDKFTAWAGADRLQVQVSVYDAADAREITSVLIESEEQDLLSGTDVEDLLQELFDPYVTALYGRRG